MNCQECECEGRTLKADIEKWSKGPTSLMQSESGREKFLQYLSDRDLNEAVDTVIFCEKAEKLQELIKKSPQPPKNTLIQRRNSLMNFAKQHVNFDMRALRELNKITKGIPDDEVIAILNKAKQSASEDLEETHSLFISYLLKDQMP